MLLVADAEALHLEPEEPVEAGSLTATFFLCAAGASPGDFSPDQCQPFIGTDFDFAFEIVNNDTGAGFALADAALSESTATWSDLPLVRVVGRPATIPLTWVPCPPSERVSVSTELWHCSHRMT